MVQAAVAGTVQPRQAVGVQLLPALELTALEEVALDVLHRVLHLPLALRVALAAEHRLEVLLGHEGAEAARQQQVAQVLVVQQHLVLVVEDLAGHAPEETERQLVGIHGGGGVERTGTEIHKLVARAAQHQHEEVDLLATLTVGTVHPVLTEVRLPVLPERQLRKLLVGTGRLVITLGDGMLQAKVSHEVEHSLAADPIQRVAVALLQAVLYLPAGETREHTQQIHYERLIAVKLVTVLTMADTARKKLFLAHTQILPHGTTVDSQLARNLALV